MENIQAAEFFTIDDAVREALSVVGDTLSYQGHDQSLIGTATDNRQVKRVEAFRKQISRFDELDLRQFTNHFLEALFLRIGKDLGPVFIQALLINPSSSSSKQRALASQILWSIGRPIKDLHVNPEQEDVFSLLYAALQGLRLGEVKNIVRPARRKARRRQPYQLAQIIWSACVLRGLLVTTLGTAAEANDLFKKGLIQDWDTTRKRCDICRELLGPREGTRIENHYRRLYEGVPASERGAQIVAELSRLQKQLYEIQTSPDRNV